MDRRHVAAAGNLVVPIMFWISMLASLGGHVALCVYVINRLHSVGIPRRPQKLLDVAWCTWLLGGCYLIAGRWPSLSVLPPLQTASIWEDTYLGLCLAVFPVAIALRVNYLSGPARAFRRGTIRTRLVDVTERLGRAPVSNWRTRCALLLPLNEFLKISVTEKRIPMPRPFPEWEGLTITHLSDLHMTGQLSPQFYHLVVDLALEQGSDLIVITGDIVEHCRCLPWIGETLGRLQAPLGVYFILGNHEERMRDPEGIRRTLTDAGLQDLGGRTVEVGQAGRRLRLAGTELPWHAPAPALTRTTLARVPAGMAADGTERLSRETLGPPWDDAPSGRAAERLTILLSHSPDQFPWARQHGVDLLLAGHTHGGQVRFPLIGPVLSPSRFGVTYASGLFYERPTVMHVSRGIAADRPVRWRCFPEIARLQLTAAPSDL